MKTLSFITKVNDLKPKKKFKYVLNECLKFERFSTAFKKKYLHLQFSSLYLFQFKLFKLRLTPQQFNFFINKNKNIILFKYHL